MRSGMQMVGRDVTRSRFLCTQAASEASKIIGAAMLERLPVITAAAPEWEVQHHAWLQGFRTDPRKQYPPQFTGVNRSGSTETDTSSMWQPASRVTQADKSGDTKTLNRRLDQRLVLLLKAPKGPEGCSVWQLPTVEHRSPESIRDTAERAVSTVLSTSRLRTFTLGNAPAAAYPQPDRLGTLFYVKMQLIEGTVEAEPPSGARWHDFAWVAADELPHYFQEDEPQAEILRALM